VLKPVLLLSRRTPTLVTVPLTVKVKGLAAVSLVAKENVRLEDPAAAAVSCTVNVVEAPGASDVLPKPAASAKPRGTLTDGPSGSVAVPALVTVKVLETGVPARVVPKLSLPVPLAMATVPSRTRADGLVTVPLTVKVKGLLALSLVAKE